MTDDDSRRHHREPLNLVVEYDGANDLVTDMTENLSAGGTFVRTAYDFEVGTEVTLSLSFPGLVDPITVPGIVRWTRKGDDDERGAGIEFVGEPEVLERVADLVERVGSGDPELVSQVCRVMVVEDNPHVARLIREGLAGGSRHAFTDVKFQFTDASNGREALDMLATASIDILVIDIYLPVLDGAAVIREVRRDPKLRALPVIAVSAGGKAAREAALEAGADFFLAKPMRLREIIETMRRLMAAT